MTEVRPQFSPSISFGQILQVAVIVVGFTGSFVVLQAQGDANTTALNIAAEERKALELRIRAIENQTARSDERYSSILVFLDKIDGRLEKMEEAR